MVAERAITVKKDHTCSFFKVKNGGGGGGGGEELPPLKTSVHARLQGWREVLPVDAKSIHPRK